MHLNLLAHSRGNAVRHIRHGGDNIHIELSVESLLDNLHMEQAQETAAETEAQRQRTLWLEGQRSVIELQLFERCTQIFVLVSLDRIDTRKDHRLNILETCNSLHARVRYRSDGISHLHIFRVLDTRADISYIARLQLGTRLHLQLQNANLVGIVLLARIEELHVLALFD